MDNLYSCPTSCQGTNHTGEVNSAKEVEMHGYVVIAAAKKFDNLVNEEKKRDTTKNDVCQHAMKQIERGWLGSSKEYMENI